MFGGSFSPRALTRAAVLLGALSTGTALVLPSSPLGVSAASSTPADAFSRAEVAHYATQLPAALQAPGTGVDSACFAPTEVDPEVNGQGQPTNPNWYLRDALNQYCATLRLRDQFSSPSFGFANLSNGADLWGAQAQEQIQDTPGHIHGGLTTLIPGSQAADPFRVLTAWHRLTGGTATQVAFTSSDGAQLRGHIFLPPDSAPEPAGGYPGVVITDGSIQAFENLYYWAAEGLAQYGYEVMTFDVQGQGDSDLFPSGCPTASNPTASCQGVPYQQNYNFFQGAEDALNFFDSSANPGFTQLDTGEIGIAGHSLGASAVSWVGQCDSRVKAVVAWDDLQPVSTDECASNVTVPDADRATTLHAPALAMSNDYEFNPQPQTTVPNPHGSSNGGGLDGDAGYQSLSSQGIDSMQVALRNGTHLTYSYIPAVLPANELGERFAFYYTLAWFDQYLRDGQDPYTSNSALSRLTDLGTYDSSADSNSLGKVSIGAGTFSATAAASDPADPEAGNVPYLISGISIPDSLSFYYYSEYRLTEPAGGGGTTVSTCGDMRAGCPSAIPPTP